MKNEFNFKAALLAARATAAEAVMQVALTLVAYAPVEAEAYAASQKRGDCQKLLKALGTLKGFEKTWREVATQHERDAMTAAWRGMTAAQFLAKNNARKQKKVAAPETAPTPALQITPAATLIKGKAQSAPDNRAIAVAHKIIDMDYKPTRAELVLLAEALIGDSE